MTFSDVCLAVISERSNPVFRRLVQEALGLTYSTSEPPTAANRPKHAKISTTLLHLQCLYTQTRYYVTMKVHFSLPFLPINQANFEATELLLPTTLFAGSVTNTLEEYHFALKHDQTPRSAP